MKIIYVIIGLVLLGGIFFYLFTRRGNTQSNSQINQQNSPINQQNGNKTKSEENKPVDNPYKDLRNQALNVTPEQLELSLTNDRTIVYGVIMDWNLGEGIATLVAFQNGEASYYLSTGGGIIGGGSHENVRKAVAVFIDKAQTSISKTTKTETTPLPETDIVKFYFLTNKGKFAVQETIANFENNSSQWLNLYEGANKVMTELRLQPGGENK